MGRRTQPRLVRTLPTAGERLREPQPHRLGVPSSRIDPPDATEALQSRLNFSDRLSRQPESGCYFLTVADGLPAVRILLYTRVHDAPRGSNKLGRCSPARPYGAAASAW